MTIFGEPSAHTTGQLNYHPGTVDPKNLQETAYDGQAEPQKRDLTARERDVLVRLLSEATRNPYFSCEEVYTFGVIAHVVNPRSS